MRDAAAALGYVGRRVDVLASFTAGLFHDGGNCRRLAGGSWPRVEEEEVRLEGTEDEEDPDERADSEDEIFPFNASCMSLRRCSRPESFFGGGGCHGIASGSALNDSWLDGGGSELDEKLRLNVRRPDIGCFDILLRRAKSTKWWSL